MFKPVRRLIGSGILAALTALLVLLARLLPRFWFSFYTDFSRAAVGLLGAFWCRLSFPVWELLLALLIAAAIVGLVFAVRKKRVPGFFAALLELLVLLAFLFVGLWGLNHFAPTVGEQIGLELRPYTLDELKAAATYFAEMASEHAGLVERDADGNLVLPELSVLSDKAIAAYERLAEKNDRYRLRVPGVKPLLSSRAFAYMGNTGIYVCLTGEPCISTRTYALSQPFTICHELGHSLAVAREDEANYLAFLACRASDDEFFRYSGYYCAFIYCYNALYAESPASARGLWSCCENELLYDNDVHVTHNKQYEGKVQEAARAVNDAYLKTFDEPGVKSYGLVVDYLIAEYLRGGA